MAEDLKMASLEKLRTPSYTALVIPSVVLSLCTSLVLCSRVLELSDRFLEVRNEGSWLVKFYAPWCGHCKHLEPVWQQVAQGLVDTDIRVGRVDCTRFTSVATEFGVRGFPTILFIKGANSVEFRGDRTKDDIAEFARRMDGPAVRPIADCEELDRIRSTKTSFFVFLEGDRKTYTLDDAKFKEEYELAAKGLQQLLYFYTAPPQCISSIQGLPTVTKMTVLVFKDKTAFVFDNSTEKLGDRSNLTLRDWINEERFPTFLKITNGNFYQLMKTGKNMVMAVLQENTIQQLSLKMQEFKDVLEAIAMNNKELYHRHFTFGWLSSPELANSVAMSWLPVPSLIVVNPETYQYYLPETGEGEGSTPAPQEIIHLLNAIVDKSATAFGGDSFPYRMYRAYYEASSALAGMWKGNPVLTCVLFGLPLGFLSIICYTSCCHDILEASEDDEPEDEQGGKHEKRD